jgi:4-oxalocrotonate tautomerase
MPYVNVKVAGSLTTDQKTALAERISAALEEVAGKPRRVTYITFEEVDRDDWAVGGELLSQRQPSGSS